MREKNGDAAGVVLDVDYVMKPFVWMASGDIRTIKLPRGATSGVGVAINNSGQVAGIYH
jgi:hypothetical protein